MQLGDDRLNDNSPRNAIIYRLQLPESTPLLRINMKMKEFLAFWYITWLLKSKWSLASRWMRAGLAGAAGDFHI